MGTLLAEFLHADRLQGFVHPAADLRGLHAQVLRAERHVVLHDGRDELVVRILEHHAAAAADLPGVLRVSRGHAADEDLAGSRQKQRVAIAGVLAMQPECIVFDEPTAMLDPSGRAEILKIIRGLHEQGKTVILITHFMEEAAQADRIIVMDQGRPILDESPDKLFAHAEKLHALNLQMPFGASMANKLAARGVALPEGIITSERLAECLCG